MPLLGKTAEDDVDMRSQLRAKIVRNVVVATYPFSDYFVGFEKVEAVRRIFGKRTNEVLRNLRVEFSGMKGYMGVSDLDGHLVVSAHYLSVGSEVDIYLDVIHELVHVRQFMDGKRLFDRDFTYVQRPTEIEAYRHTVEEARKLGLQDDEICEYLKTEWMSDEDMRQLAKTLNVECSRHVESSSRRI